MMAKSSYTGKIGLGSAQVVKAPITGPKSTKTPKVAKGGDQRGK